MNIEQGILNVEVEHLYSTERSASLQGTKQSALPHSGCIKISLQTLSTPSGGFFPATGSIAITPAPKTKILIIYHTAIAFLINRVLDEKFLISPCGRTSFGSVPGEWPRQTK
jgi:hypothetical protein